jgi:hypothetical protein
MLSCIDLKNKSCGQTMEYPSGVPFLQGLQIWREPGAHPRLKLKVFITLYMTLF